MLLSTIPSTNIQVAQSPNLLEGYLRHLSGQEKEQDVISADHNYSKLWCSHADSHHAKPARMLFMKGLLQRTVESNTERGSDLDVESVVPDTPAPYDNAKTRAFMEECDNFLATNMTNPTEEDKEPLNKTGWTTAQKNLHKHVLKILNSNLLSRLAHSGTDSELVKRRVVINKGAKRMRQLFAAYCWDMTLLGWLHHTVLDNLSASLLTEYFEIIRTLKAKMPNLIDKLLMQVGAMQSGIFAACSTEAFNQLMRKPWDPVINALSQNKMKKLPGNPLIVIIPSSPNHMLSYLSQRTCFWNFQLSALGKIIQLPLHTSNNIAVDECLHQMFTMAKNKVIDLKSQSPKRPIILLGWTIGALIACHVAIEESVNAVVCLGFPFKGISGARGDLDDPLLDNKVPTLFVIGQNSNLCSMDDIEDFRERMRAETGLVVVGGADDKLRTSTTRKKLDGVTQNMVDKCILDEIEEFLVPLLSHQYATSPTSLPSTSKKATVVQEATAHDDTKRQRRRPREYSPEISPVRKKARPVGRPSLQKTFATSSSSETSSAFSGDGMPRKDKKKLSRKSRSNALKKRKEGRSQSPVRPSSSLKVVAVKDLANQKSSPVSPALPVASTTSAATTPTTTTTVAAVEKLNPAKILAEQQKNGPVDVEKAFGKDSSFLPRPLTPAEFNNNESTLVKTPENIATTSENLVVEAKVTQSTSVLNVSLSPVSRLPDKPVSSFLKTSVGSFPFTAFSTNVSPTVAIQKPQVVSKILESSTITTDSGVATSSTQNSFSLQSSDVLTVSGKSIIASPQNRTISGSGLSVKHVHGIMSSLTSKGILSTASGSSPKTLLVTSPSGASNKPTTLLVSSSDPTGASKKIQFRRMVVQSGAASKMPILTKLTTGGVSVVASSSATEQRVCNLSLLSDVAGMKEPIKQVLQDGPSTSNATLVKLSEAGAVKHLKVIEAFPTSSSGILPPQRFETPEELAEKQMAIRALSYSLNEDGSGNYTVPRTDSPSSMLGYSRVIPRSSHQGLAMRNPPRRARSTRGAFVGMSMPRRTRGKKFFSY